MDFSTVKWMDLFLAAVNDCVPKIEIKSANSAPWIDANVLKAVRRKERLRKRARRSSSAYHWAIFRLRRAELKSLIKWKRKPYFKGLSTTLTENSKRFWAYYQAKYKNKRIPSSLQYNGVKVSDAHEKAELFNNYFNSVFKRDDCVPLHEDYFFSGFDNANQSLSNITLSPSMVREFLDQLNTTKSCGPDEITPRLLKECSKSLSIPLCTLFNKQLDSGCFPKVWKVANLVPVFKSDDREMVQNYRGISLLCIISKVLEKCVFSYVFPFFQPQIYHLQDGFVSGRSCVTSLLRSTHAFAKALDERKQVDTIFLDYSKAFDSVSFNCLLKELFDVGVRGKLLSWFRSYLTCRHHRTVIDGCESSLLPISSGVPQGSNLGPLLFTIYINTAPKAIHSSTTVQLYADDMKCFKIIDNTDDVQQLQSDLSNLNDWSANHFMEFNSKKCKYLAITRKKNIVDSAYTLNGSQIIVVK